MPIPTVRSFADAINTHDVSKIISFMSQDHLFIDAQGKEFRGVENMEAGWSQYFALFPDYRIELEDVIASGTIVLAQGYASGSYKGETASHWRLPAAWRAVVDDGSIKVWQVYADCKIPSDIIAASSASAVSEKSMEQHGVTGIGGVFFKCRDAERLKEWYKKHLNLDAGKYGASFEWYEAADSTKKGTTQWTPFAESSKYFEPSSKDFMLNYRVANLEEMVTQLKANGVTVLDDVESYDFGKFVHIMDLEGNKVELWEPVG